MTDDNKQELLNILKVNKDNGKMFNKGFTILNKNIINSIKANISVGKSITSAIKSLGQASSAMSKEMSSGFTGMIDAEKKALAFDKSSATSDSLKEGEDTREGKKKSVVSDLPKGKDLIDPKKWGMFAKSFVMSLFGMLTSLITTILLPLAMGAMKGYYSTIAKFFKGAFKAFGALLRFGVRVLTFIGGLLKDLGKSKAVTAALDLAKGFMTSIGSKISGAFSGLFNFLKGTKIGKGFASVLTFITDIGKSVTGGFTKLLGTVSDLFGKGIFATTDFFKGIPKSFAESSIGKFFAKVKGIFSHSIFGSFDEAGAMPKTFADTKLGQFLAKVKGFFKLPLFTKAADMFTVGFKFAETGIGKLITKIKGFLGIGADAAKFGGGVLGDIGDMGKGLAESSVGKFFTKIKNFFGMGAEPGPFTKLIETFKKVFSFELPPGIAKTMGAIGKVFGKVFAVFGIFMGVYEAVKAFTGTEGTVGEKIVAALKAFIDEVVFGLPNFLIEMVGKGVSALLDFLGFGDASKAVADATKDFSIMDLISDNIGKFWTWIKGFFSDLFTFDGLSLENMLPKFDFDIGNPLKIVGEKLSAIFKGLADFAYDKMLVPDWFGDLFAGVATKVAGWGQEKKLRTGGLVQQVTGEQVPAILHANEIVLAESSAKLFLQAAQMFADPKYTNAMKDMVKANANIKTETTSAIMQAGAMSGGDGGTAQMIASLAQQTSAISQTMAQIPGAVQEGANSGTFSGSQSGGFSKLSNPHEKKPK